MTSQGGPPQWSGRDTVKGLLISGTTLLVFGVIFMGANWPSTEFSALAGPYESGSPGWTLVGALIAATGQVLVAIAAVACGVRVGTRPD